MGIGAQIKAVYLFLIITPHILAQEPALCAYFTAIPKEPRPDDLPEPDLSGTTWATRPLHPAPYREDVCMDTYSATGNFGTQSIHIDEEIDGDVIIARLNYDGAQVPYIGQFLVGTRNLLNPVIRREPDLGNDWFLVITSRQDYETPSMQRYMFEVNIEGQTLVARVSLEIVNIDDNPPVIQLFDTCTVPELGEVPRLTECVYEVTDADGEISTRFMTFGIDSDRGDDLIFSLHGENIPNDWFRMYMTIGLEEELNFETSALHIFSVSAFDSLPNNHTLSMMVQVENVESRPPRWVETWAVQQFDEKTNQSFTVRAIDGDTGINKPILYRLNNPENYPFFSIETLDEGRGGGVFYVEPIDRDALEQEVFQLSIVAYKFDNESFATEVNIVIIVNDVNDQIPEPLQDEYYIRIMEETPLTLNFEDEFGFYDRDLGEHAQYQVRLESVFPPGVAEAFYIAPDVGYQRQTFTMGTINHTMLDYELPEFQNIIIRVIAQDLHNPDFIGNATVYIDLINWNDEEPIFPEPAVTVAFNETEGAGFFVGTVRAYDRDIDDAVVHTLMGNANQYLTIDNVTGDIYVSMDEAFDYHRQSELFVQIRADDTLGEPYNTATSQLVIQLLDINNTPPSLRLPRGSPLVEENVPDGYLITDQITASDPDSTAELVFEIDWDTSYATKQGRETSAEEFHNCVEIETVYPVPAQRGEATGRVLVREIRDNVTIDFEEFEVLYLSVRVRDLNTVLGEPTDELTFTVIIVDMNDNAPVWVEGTLATEFRVREVSASGVVVGSVLATDIDGPLYNQVRYTIFPREDTPDGLVQIDFFTGQLSVQRDQAIDADVPPRENLYYTVVASDRCYEEDEADCPPDTDYWETPGDITIYIIDTNNKRPEPRTEEFDAIVYIYENATSGDEVVEIRASDLDRDEMYNTVRYQMNYVINSRLRDFFEVDLDTGLVYVNYTTDEVLDRDGDEPEHRIFLTLFDNFFSEGDGNRNQEDLEVLVVLLDVNDNAPELPPPTDLSWSISENLQEQSRLVPIIYAPDRDEPGTDNSRVAYEIVSLTVTDRVVDLPELFTMVNIDNVTGELETAMPLRGYWGTYDIHIRAYDHGIPQMSSNETYALTVRPYNFHTPEFVSPVDGTTVRLAREGAVINGLLSLVSGEVMDRIAAVDEDGMQAGQVAFTITGDGEAQQYFSVANDGENLGSLVLTQLFSEDIREFQVTIRATDGGTEPGPLFSESTITVVFVPTLGDPVFITTSADVAFLEQDGGLEERFQLPLAQDPKNFQCTEDCHDVFYSIYGGNDNGQFAVEPETNVIYLVSPLNRTASQTHTLQVAASNSDTPPQTTPASLLTVTVTVREANPRPIFERSSYMAGISTLDTISRELLTVRATHSEGAAITYSIDNSSFVVDPTLEAVQGSAFLLNEQTGVLTLNMQPTASMQGMFEFEVLATDTVGAYDRTRVNIYLVSTLNRVFFIFYNTIEQVEPNREFIEQTFSTGFNMACNIDQVVPASNANGVALDSITEVRAHFIQDDRPVDVDTIEQLRSDTEVLRSIQLTLNTELLILQDFVTDISPAAGLDSAWVTVYALAAIALALALACLLLLGAYFIRTRALNRRLEALSTTKFGSVDSGLNRAGVAVVPGTNKHAVEGSNPIWNEQIRAPNFDAISDDGSDNSDLIGIEDLPQFRQDYFPPDDGNSLDDFDERDNPITMKDSVANHQNNFGFNASPFSPNFGKSPFNRQ